jgi:hypothetical protein
MTVLWGDIEARVRRLLEDTDSTAYTWTELDMVDYANAALKAVAIHTARENQVVYSLTSDLASYTLPDDVLQLGAVILTYISVPEILQPVRLQPQNILPSTISRGGATGFYQWPKGTINFLRPILSGRTLTINYWSYYPTVVDVNTPLTGLPRWAEEAVKWKVMIEAIAKVSGQEALLAQWKQKRDAGTPEQQSLITISKFYQFQYDKVLYEHAPQDRGMWNEDQ